MDKIVLNAKHRKVVGKKVKVLRRQGRLPAALFGYGVESTPISLDMRESSRTLGTVGASTLVTLDLEGKEYNALVRERQYDVLTRALLHVDFQAVSMTETVRARVAIYIGEQEAPAVENYSAILNTGIDMLEIECLPQDLPDRIYVDVSILTEIGDSIQVKDISIAENIQILDDPNAMVVVASSPFVEEEEEEDVDELMVDGAEPDVIEKGKLEEEDEE